MTDDPAGFAPGSPRLPQPPGGAPTPPPPPPPGHLSPGARHPWPGTAMSTPIPQIAPTPAPAGAFGPSLFRGILCGLLASVVGGALWYGVVIATDRQIYYLAILLGLFIGYAVTWGAGRGGPGQAVVSIAIAGIGVIGAYYFIDRHLIIVGGESLGYIYDIPLAPTYDQLKAVLRVGFETEKMQYLFCALCVGAAGVFGFKGVQQSRRFSR
ncbi:MAG: hypothetical protein WCC60_03780 [Ilumatobacteraceae bacterium]